MSICALTGGFLCGKSTALKLFKDLGVETFDLDTIYHKLLQSSDQMQELLREELGLDQLVDTALIKKALKEEKISMERLSELTHPFIIAELKKIIADLRLRVSAELVLIEVPLLYECELDDLFDKVLVVAVGKSVLEARAKERGYDMQQLNMIVDSQLDIAEKIKRADIVIENNGSPEDLNDEIRNIYKYLDSMQKEA